MVVSKLFEIRKYQIDICKCAMRRLSTFAVTKNNKMENNTKIALITGGSRGLGRDMALRLAEKGIQIILTYRSRKEEALKVVAQVEQAGQKAVALQLDVANIKSFGAFTGQLKEVLHDTFHAEGIDFLINNGGIGGHALFQDVTEEMFDELLQVHFKGVYFFTQKLLPLLNDGGGGDCPGSVAYFSTRPITGISAYASCYARPVTYFSKDAQGAGR
jgi:NAD(P)-dependent dehydrogenase (short-subunit alcohol dehydrogenase family)